ncbi:MAG: VCBS repeat-containing protein, partial [Planctomycetota bacterium]|nr:VCBS repeat-containing protein [Planctomycetota bacterium]
HSAYRFDIGDLNSDGLPDIVVPADGAGGVFVFRNRNQATKWTVTQLDKRRAGLHCPNIIQLADVNQDGHLDILATDWAHKAVAWIYRPQRSVR